MERERVSGLAAVRVERQNATARFGRQCGLLAQDDSHANRNSCVRQKATHVLLPPRREVFLRKLQRLLHLPPAYELYEALLL